MPMFYCPECNHVFFFQRWKVTLYCPDCRKKYSNARLEGMTDIEREGIKLRYVKSGGIYGEGEDIVPHSME